MAESLHSPYWYRVARLKPKLRTHALVERHEYRGQASYVVQDPVSGSHHRLNATARYLISLMDGERTVDQIWNDAMNQLGDAAPVQDEMIHLLGKLHSADLLQCDVTPDSAELFRRFQKQQKQQLKQRWMNPLAFRIPLFDPQRFLTRWLSSVQWLFSKPVMIVYTLIIGSALVLTGMHWPELTDQMFDRALAPQNILLLFFIYPLVKMFHEFGHAFATRVWGGEVHEMGITFLVLMPIPYVDASSASAFADKHKRMVVGAAGMFVEWFLAAVSLFVWLAVEPGLTRDIAWNVMMIGGISTLLFNGNPLLRFDGYFILADAVEIPNLGRRAQQHLGYLVQKHLFGLDNVKSPATSAGERRWFVGYGILAFIYRMAIMATIVIFIAGKFFLIGVLLAIWAVVFQVVLPLFKQIRFVLSSPQVRPHRLRAVGSSVGIISALALLLFAMPVSDHSNAEGVLWLPEQAQVRSGADGFVESVLVKADQTVRKGDVLIRCVDPELDAKVGILESRLQELQARYTSNWSDDRVQAKLDQEQIKATEADLARAIERRAGLVIQSPSDGRFVLPGAEDLEGRFLKQGELIAYVLQVPLKQARVVVRQVDADRVRRRTQSVELRPVTDTSQLVVAELQREIPAASNQLPSKALGNLGGGKIAVDPTDEDGLRAAQSIFQFEVALPEEAGLRYSGSRVYVRFDNGEEPLGFQWYRSVRQLFLRQFSV